MAAVRAIGRVALWCALAALLASCGTIATAPTPAPATPGLSPVPTTQQITIDTPASGASVTSPFAVSGRTALAAAPGSLQYRLVGPDGSQLAAGPLELGGAAGGPSTFAGSVQYQAQAAGSGRLEVFELDLGSGTVRTIQSVVLALGVATAPGATPQVPATAVPTVPPGPTAVPPTVPPAVVVQQILIDTPAAGTSVGSPVVLTGRTATSPSGGVLRYRVVDQAQQTIGQGVFGVAGAPGQPGSFTASLSFSLPPRGGDVRVDLFDQASDGAVLAQSAIGLWVEPPQQILIETPPPGTVVGSPVVITGSTARAPFQGNLAYIITDGARRQVGAGVFPVQSQPRQPGRFVASLGFSLPLDGGPLLISVFDQDASSGFVAARAEISLQVNPVFQQITIETPPSGTVVGSPVVITGSTARYPRGGSLSYRVLDTSNLVLARGSFATQGQPNQPVRFVVSITFEEPRGGGQIRVEISDIEPLNGAVVASSAVVLVVNPPPAPEPRVTP